MMTEEKTGERHAECDAVRRIRAIKAKRKWKDETMAAYLGVPVTTLRNWLGLHRQPPAVVDRLLYVLGYVEAFGGRLHDHFLP